MSDNNEILPCVIIPMHDSQLLLPNVSIAEVVDFATSDPDAGSPDWLVGWLEWRGLRLPVVSYDAANGNKLVVPGGNRGRVVVLNTIGQNHAETPFLALVTQGIPSQIRIGPDQVREIDGEKGSADQLLVEVDGDTAVIPDLEYLEKLAHEAA
jgi:chemosensory pili system protein ChpC